MLDPDKPQTWFIQVAFEDIYHVHALLIQGTLAETLKKVRYLSQRTGCLANVYALERQQIQPQADHIFKAMSEEGMLLVEVARVNYDYATWTRTFNRIFEELPQEQHLAELENFRQRIDKEIAALMMLVDKVVPPQPQQIEAQRTEQPEQPKEEVTDERRTTTGGSAPDKASGTTSGV